MCADEMISNQCCRCGKYVTDEKLKKPPLIYRIVLIPLFMFKSGLLVKQAQEKYCPKCRRSINASYFFIIFLIMLFVAHLLWKYVIRGMIEQYL